MAEEGLKRTPNDMIHIGCPIPFDEEEFLERLEFYYNINEVVKLSFSGSKTLEECLNSYITLSGGLDTFAKPFDKEAS